MGNREQFWGKLSALKRAVKPPPALVSPFGEEESKAEADFSVVAERVKVSDQEEALKQLKRGDVVEDVKSGKRYLVQSLDVNDRVNVDGGNGLSLQLKLSEVRVIAIRT